MIAISANDLIPAPQMMSVAFSITEAAIADSAQARRVAFHSLRDAMAELKEVLGRVLDHGDELFAASRNLAGAPATYRQFLDVTFEAERDATKLHDLIVSLTGRKPVRAALAGSRSPLRMADLAAFGRELGERYMPFLRRLRLSAIETIAARARQGGVDVLRLDDAERQAFLDASLAETEGWQETAFLLTDVAAARRLDASIRSVAHDRTDALLLDT